MPFNMKKYRGTDELTNGNVGSIMLDMAISLRAINSALIKLSIQSGCDISEETQKIERTRRELWDAFENMTGWTRESGDDG